MDQLYEAIRKRAKEIAKRYPPPSFYDENSRECAFSRRFFETDETVGDLYSYVSARIDDDLGHGLDHVTKVTLDAGALVLAEEGSGGEPGHEALRRLFLVQCAGLLHDIARKEKNHAAKGAEMAEDILSGYALTDSEKAEVCQAISNHEAFRPVSAAITPRAGLLSDCLYDADKFRWGPDNFTDTVWAMISFFKAPLSVFLDRYAEGIEGIIRIKSTFRSVTGRRFGPEFIDTGLLMGDEIYRMLKDEFEDKNH